MTRRLLGSLLVSVLIHAPTTSAQQIVMLPQGSWANDVTPDGEVVVGTWNYYDGFIWRWRVEPAPTVIPSIDLVAVSDDGTVAAGNISHPGTGATEAGIWTAATGVQGLGQLGSCDYILSSAFDLSGDGTTVVGLAWNGCSGRGFRWTAASGMQELQNLANGNNRCSAISGDGTALGGFAQGTTNRTPAFWQPNTSGFVLNPNFEGEVYGFNQDGSRSVGTNYFGNPLGTYGAFVRDSQTGVMTNLGSLTSGWGGNAADLSEDGKLIVGFDTKSLARKAWVWTATDGIKSLNDRLAALGVSGVPELEVCRACSDEGNVVVGGGRIGGGPFDFAGYIVEFDTPNAQWTDLGNGLAGTNGIPLLKGTGPLVSATSTSVVVSSGKSSAPAAFVVGLSPANLPFKQGVLVPFPDLLVTAALAPSGSLAFQFPWPAGLPANFSAYWQCLVSDPVAPGGFALSNALRSTTP